ncbi:hypothetical protein ACFRAE_11310 [Sphingobacterium sp. HJSM2_6]|uniref:hypothetical protein n=1 Tax=Sphingobacterium sp. HJSM2_6 TaxID=3366264 RepID=UPI003BD4BA7C
MKKSLILYLLGTFIFIIGFFFQIKLLGKVFINDEYKREPRNWYSSIMKNLDQPDSLKIASLDQINTIVIKGSTNFNIIRILFNKENNFRINKNGRNYAYKREIINDTLFIPINNDAVHEFIIHLKNDHEPNIILDNCWANIQMESVNSNSVNNPKIHLKNKSYAIISKSNNDDDLKINTLNLIADSKSTFSLSDITANKLNAKLDNGMIDYYKECDIDSIQAELIGLSHIRGLKNEGKFKDIKLSGDLSYYNSHP